MIKKFKYILCFFVILFEIVKKKIKRTETNRIIKYLIILKKILNVTLILTFNIEYSHEVYNKS